MAVVITTDQDIQALFWGLSFNWDGTGGGGSESRELGRKRRRSIVYMWVSILSILLRNDSFLKMEGLFYLRVWEIGENGSFPLFVQRPIAVTSCYHVVSLLGWSPAWCWFSHLLWLLSMLLLLRLTTIVMELASWWVRVTLEGWEEEIKTEGHG